MCGIVGFLGNAGSAASDVAVARAMANLLRHRGPDDEGIWVDPEVGIALAQRRLAVVDLSPSGHQPMLSADGRFVVTFNGEIYNHKDIRLRLEAEGVGGWRGTSDTEVLVEAIARWGVKQALEACVGMFALALWDRRERRLTLARDRMGEKPLYFGRIGRTFAFASELKAFAAHPHWRPEIDRNAVALLMRHNYVPAPYSIFKGIGKLRPGNLLTISAGAAEPRTEPYWSARDVASSPSFHAFSGTATEAADALESLLRQSLAGQMLADVPVGAFLSGGIDSSAVVAVMQSMSARPVRTFTIGFGEEGYNEATFAKAVAQHLKTDHTELYISDREARDVIPELPNIYCEPFSDSSQIPTHLVAKLARRDVTVALSGDGGDELFGGYTRYAIAESFWDKLSLVPTALRRTAASLAMSCPPGLYDAAARPLARLVPRRYRMGQVGDKIHKAAKLLALRNPDEIYRYLCSHWLAPEVLVLGAEEQPTMLTGLETLPEFPGNVERMMYIDLLSYLPDDILVKVDRAAMAVSLETRVPLLDHRIVEFAMSLPLSLCRAGGATKLPLRQVLHRYVPRALVERPKMGFGVPIGGWLRGPLRDWAEALLGDARLKEDGILDPVAIRQAWSEHLSGRRNHQYLLWDVLMFQAWYTAREAPRAAMAA